MAIVLNRRALLEAAGMAVLAMPALELTAPRRARAGGAGAIKRFVLMYCGLSTGRDGEGQLIVPNATGAGYDLPRSLMPLGTDALPYGGSGFDVRDEVSVISGLTIPWADSAGATPPPGGRSREFHYNSVGPSVSGMRGESFRYNPANGPSADQLVADAIAGDTVHRLLSYRVQAVNYVGANGGVGDSARVSWYADGGGNIVGVDPIASPRLAYQSLFSGFVPPDPADALAAQRLLSRRRSVLDTLRVRTQALLPRMSGYDRMRMQQHFDELAAFEARLDAMPPPTTGACELPTDPGEDPAIGDPHGTTAEGNLDYDQTAGYSGEDERATAMVDMIRMAFACDLSRVVSLRMTMDQTFLNMLPLSGAASDMHELSHGAVTADDHADAVGWHIKHFARLISLLRDTQELDGSSLLDHTAVVMLFEGGYGYDPESDADGHAHSTENMVALVGGRTGGLMPGVHISAPGMHPANAVLTAMQAAGLQTDTLGEISGAIPGLIV
ncbi:MAG: DUF1552 domain-containing protein [Deltaproteobacteria bacterium]|nr:DUF1552 domain-containing protein [Deltaproteobacteria bacterium]MBK8233992.1 DUF1552 domain-containing protein [Deltaproteobacteria bacterium]MBK8714710.1 DUF1552 domain-containing protein [Deltaproteobacteria bacterium]MBP7289242.1 DUF1552 domain-containing protein [Nannocystaceae bacterium]